MGTRRDMSLPIASTHVNPVGCVLHRRFSFEEEEAFPLLWWEKIAIWRQVVARVEVEKEGAPSGGGRAADAQHVPIVSLSGFLLGHKRTQHHFRPSRIP